MQIPAFTCVTIEDSDLELAEIDGSDCERLFK